MCFQGAPRAYTVAASGSGPSEAFTLSNGDESIDYRVEWLPQVDQSTIDALSDGIPATIHAIADRSDCGRSQLRIAIDSADSARINAGAPYTGSLILTLAPE